MKYSFESRKATQDFIPLNIDAWRIFVIFFQNFFVCLEYTLKIHGSKTIHSDKSM